MGELGGGRLGFALKCNRTAAPLLERTRELALSSVPTNYAPLIFRYAKHHFKESIDWSQLPFGVGRSQKLAIPVPEFASRVRELEVEKIYRHGSHTFFVAKIVSDERLSDEKELCAIHGFYQAWRLRGQSVQLRASLERHTLHKHGPIPTFSRADPF
jgi:flavin reductase (DIM6/NTAB) family NADH-FMN oxidoreductase RutF